jgi:hypothetical protein
MVGSGGGGGGAAVSIVSGEGGGMVGECAELVMAEQGFTRVGV